MTPPIRLRQRRRTVGGDEVEEVRDQDDYCHWQQQCPRTGKNQAFPQIVHHNQMIDAM
jgi:hypothetical protein